VDDGAALATSGVQKGDSIMLYNKLPVARSVVIASLAIFLSGPAFADSRTLPAASNNGSFVMPARRPPPPPQVPVTRAQANTDEAQRYASREVNAKGLETFLGGERGGIYIGSGVLIVALLVVLIIVLI
jgi:hypothetical protein